jgi:2,5-diamino-6-(ribosylamino)-4(3H)-pyrimidinone 5'-phosphate reductase
LQRLFPDHEPVSPEEAYSALSLAERAPDDRPYVISNMVSTADGRATLGGRTKELSTEADRALFHSLREQVDAVMAGTATIAIERYGPLVRGPERRRRRAERGLEPVPLAVTATRSMELPTQAPLFADPESRIVVLTGSDREPPPAAAEVIVERLPTRAGAELDLVAGMERLRRKHGVRTVLLEGGPTLLGAMLEAGLVDELFLSLAPLIVGGAPEAGLVEGPALPQPLRLSLLGLLEEESFLFLRYAVGASG